ncbi:MAG: hypothetical protein Q9225_006413, partial [Loekoesia sp. 1 TL-2023]
MTHVLSLLDFQDTIVSSKQQPRVFIPVVIMVSLNSSADVVAVEFRPERGNLFVLAFADGTCAMYDAAPMFRGGNDFERKSNASGTETGWEVSHIKGLHRPRKATSRGAVDSHTNPYGTDSAKSPFSGDQSVGVTAIGFVPSHKTIVVTVGSDYRCCVIDFKASEDREATLICAWDIVGPATCLSILTPSPQSSSGLPVARLDFAQRTSIVAIGHQDGQILFFNLAGNLLVQQTPEPGGHGIIDVEWMEDNDWPRPSESQPAQSIPGKQNHRADRKSLGSVLASGRTVAEEVVAVIDEPGTGEESRNITRPMETFKSASGTAEDKAEDATRIPSSSALSYLGLPSVVRELYPTETNFEDSSGRADTSSSGSLEDILKNFQFPSPPNRSVIRVVPQQQQQRGGGQLPRNNSWAAEFQPRNAILRKASHDVASNETDVAKRERSGKSALFNGQRKRQALEDLKNGPAKVATDPKIAHQEDLWTDIGVDDSGPTKMDDPGSSDKENTAYNNVSNTVEESTAGTLDIKPFGGTHKSQAPQAGHNSGTPFPLHMDKRDQSDHPQPLSAHPEKSPTMDPRSLARTNVNSSHETSAIRAPFHRQRYRNGNLESHRSSIYGPGALARKVQQEVMITVNVELDVLRREMSEKFADQRSWFIKELMNTQEWTLRVEEENRKLREELAKERKKRVGDRE